MENKTETVTYEFESSDAQYRIFDQYLYNQYIVGYIQP